MRLLMLVLVAITVAACSDRVPAPATPTPTPRPGYPPAPSSELPEGMLFLEQTSPDAPMLFGIGPDGEARAYERGSMFAVSPDGMKAAMVAMEKSIATGEWLTAGLGLLTVEGYEEVERSPQTGWPSVVWSSDGRRLAYALPDESDSGMTYIWALDTESGEKTLLSEEADSSWLLSWTADGDVLSITPDGLALLGKTRRVIGLPEPGSVLDAQLSPDGRSVAIKLGAHEQEPQTELTYVHSSGIWVFGLTSGGWRELLDLSDEPAGVATTGWQAMQWSPDGRRITVHGTRTDDSGRLIVLDVETGQETLVHEQGRGWESWSPDSQYLAYMYEDNPGTWTISGPLGILGPDGRLREASAPFITRDATVYLQPRGLAWAANGRLMVDVPGHLSLMDPETMRMEDVVTADEKSVSALLEAPVWSPSGRYVAVSTPSDQVLWSSLYVVDTEEGTAELFLKGAGFSAVAWLRE